MKVREGFIRQEVMGQVIVVPTGDAGDHVKGMIKLNATGDIIWQGVSEGKTEEEIAEILHEKCEVSIEQALSDTKEFIAKMKEIDIFND